MTSTSLTSKRATPTPRTKSTSKSKSKVVNKTDSVLTRQSELSTFFASLKPSPSQSKPLSTTKETKETKETNKNNFTFSRECEAVVASVPVLKKVKVGDTSKVSTITVKSANVSFSPSSSCSASLPSATQQTPLQRLFLKRKLGDSDDSSSSPSSTLTQPQSKLQPPPSKPLLPSTLALLSKLFHALESVLAFHATRDKPPTFHLIRKPVENLCHRDFTIHSLLKIVALFKHAYRLTPVKVVVDKDTGRSEESVLVEMRRVVLPESYSSVTLLVAGGASDASDASTPTDSLASDSLNSATSATSVPSDSLTSDETATRTSSLSDTGFSSAVDTTPQEEFVREKPFAEALEKRRALFAAKCLDHVARFHEAFLDTLSDTDRSTFLSPRQTETQWHPLFNLEQDVPDVEPIPLPSLKSVTAAASSKPSVNTNPVSSKAFVDSTEPTPSATIPSSTEPESKPNPSPTEPTQTPSTQTSAPQTPALSKLAALKARLREKERLRAESAPTTRVLTPDQQSRLLILSHTTDTLRALLSYFSARGKTTLPMKEVVEYVCTGSRNFMAYETGRECVLMVAEVCPDWCSVVKVGSAWVVKFDGAKEDGMVGKVRERVEKVREEVMKG